MAKVLGIDLGTTNCGQNLDAVSAFPEQAIPTTKPRDQEDGGSGLNLYLAVAFPFAVDTAAIPLMI